MPNVGYHELAHALDAADGSFDGEVPRPRGPVTLVPDSEQHSP